MTGKILFIYAVLTNLTFVPVARAADAIATGADAFSHHCAICHSPLAGHNKAGPSLFGIVGRKSGAIATYHYSSAMAQAGKIWTPDELNHFLTKPSQAVPGTKMPFQGLPDDDERHALIAYLATVR